MPHYRLAFPAIGTQWLIDIYSECNPREIERVIKERVEEFDKTYSRFRKDSIVWEISRKKGEYEFPEDSKDLFSMYKKLYTLTQGSFTVLIGSALSQAGYDENYSLVPGEIEKLPKEEDVFNFHYPLLKVKKPHLLDFGGLGKGYMIDILSNLLKKNNINSFCIDAGGDIYAHKLENALRIGLENPQNLKQVVGVCDIKNGSICASSGNRRKWGDYHHIMDAKKLRSSDKVLATWVKAKDALTADAVATCLFLTEAQTLLKHFEFEYVVLYPDFSAYMSPNFGGELFTKN